MNQAIDHLQQATLRLAQDGSIKDRLADAYASHLIDLDTEELPEPVRSQFCKLTEAMHREAPLPRESAIRASVRKMSNEEARRYAALVVRLFADMARDGSSLAQTHARRALNIGNAPIVRLLASEN